MTEEELRKAAASRRRQAARADEEKLRKRGKRARRKTARAKPDQPTPARTGVNPTGRLYTHNSRKPGSAYHVAGLRGTVCKLENSGFMRYQDVVMQSPPPGKRLCSMCAAVLARKEADTAAWERLDAF